MSGLAQGSSTGVDEKAPRERGVLEAVRQGDEEAFMWLVKRHYPGLLKVAMMYVPNRSVAEEVIQDTWEAVISGLGRFEGRSSLKTWIYAILINKALTRGRREAKSVPFSALAAGELQADEPAVDPDRFHPAHHDRWPGHWSSHAPQSWRYDPEDRLLQREARACVEETIASLPPAQRKVITLRDGQGWTAEEVCELLGLSEGNQRVLLHRARSKVRAALERYMESDD